MNNKKISFASHILNSSGYPELSTVWINANKIQSYLSSLVLQEMRSLSLNEQYWNELNNSDEWQIKLFNINRLSYKKIFNFYPIKKILNLFSFTINDKNNLFLSSTPNPTIHSILEDSKDSIILNNYIQLIYKNFDDCLLILGLITDSNKYLELIYSILLNSNQILINNELNSNNLNKDIETILNYFLLWYKKIFYVLFNFLHILNNNSSTLFSSKFNRYNYSIEKLYENSIDSNKNISISNLNKLLSNLNEEIELIFNIKIQQNFPLNLVTTINLPPNSLEKYWSSFSLSTYLTFLASNKLYVNIMNGNIEKFIEKSIVILKSSVQEHVYEPLEKILDYFFNTLSSKNDIVISQNELYQSQISLQNMLMDFVKRVKINPNEIKLRHNFDEDDMKLILDYSKNFSSTLLNSKLSLMPPDVLEKHLSVLMNVYEQDLAHPIQGMIKGELMSALLIQVQKLKVHTERVMLTLDQLLASNKINLAIVSAIPAFFLVYTCYNSLKTFFQPKVYSTGEATLRFRMILSDVERALFKTYEAQKKLSNIKNQNNLKNSIKNELQKDRNEENNLEINDENDNEFNEEFEDEIEGDDLYNFNYFNLPTNPQSYSYKKFEFYKSKGLIAYHVMRFHSKFNEIYQPGGIMNLKKIIKDGLSESEPKFLIPNFETLYDNSSTTSSYLSIIKSISFTDVLFSPLEVLSSLISPILTPFPVIKNSISLAKYSIYSTLSWAYNLLTSVILTNKDKASLSLQYDSMLKDIELLESSNFDLSVEGKLKIITRMRQNYKYFN